MFERIYYISAKPKRFPFKVKRVHPFQGKVLGHTAWWKAGSGAWGCYLSHLHILLEAIHDKLDSYLVLEADALLAPDFNRKLDLFSKYVPNDWGQVYLGGQFTHLDTHPPRQLSPYIFKGGSINRTHAFGLSHRAMPKVLEHLTYFPDFIAKDRKWHIDHQLENGHRENLWSVYSPTWWLVGQSSGKSQISGNDDWDRWWHHPRYAHFLPFIHLPSPENVPDNVAFSGFRNTQPFRPVELLQQLHKPDGLPNYLKWVRETALTYNRIPALHYPDITLSQIQEFVPNVVESFHKTWQELADYPRNQVICSPYEDGTFESFGPSQSAIAAFAIVRPPAPTATEVAKRGVVEEPANGTGTGAACERVARGTDGGGGKAAANVTVRDDGRCVGECADWWTGRP